MIESTYPVEGGERKQIVWEKFAPFHYAPNVFNKSCECHLIKIAGYGWIGFIASRQYRGRFGADPRPVFTAHKTAIKLPVDHPDYFRLWALCADEQARMHVQRGHRFVPMAPMDHARYRDLPNSGWKPSATDKRRQKEGYRSHEYIGAAMAAESC